MDTEGEEKSWDWVEERLVLPGVPGKMGQGGIPGMARARPPGARAQAPLGATTTGHLAGICPMQPGR